MFKNFEIKLNNIQSIILVISIFTIGILSFALGFLIGKDSPSEVITLKTEQPKTTASLEKKDSDIIHLPLPRIEEEQEAKTAKVTPKETEKPVQQAQDKELTFFKTLPDTKKTEGGKNKDEKKIKDAQKKAASQSLSSTTPDIFPHKGGAQSTPLLHKNTDEKKTADNHSIKPETRPASTASTQLSYTVQAGSFKTMNEASNFKSKLDKKGYHTYITTYDTPDGKWFRVRIGQFKTKDEAESLIKKLKSEENLASFITQYK
ncbi:MAG: SPOR domain-containing protein [Nitrospinae bacterium]|nr:SPOR domain-containing protein [Nitrospinota bacterium]